MPAVLTETERPLEGISEGTPPCACLWKWAKCENPGAWRISSVCPGCKNSIIVFICNRCHEKGVLNGFLCTCCRFPGRGIDGYL